MDFTQYVKGFRQYKFEETGSKQLTAKELASLRESYKSMQKEKAMPASRLVEKKMGAKKPTSLKERNAAKNSAARTIGKPNFRKFVEEFRDYKESQVGTRALTANDKKQLVKAFKEMNSKVAPKAMTLKEEYVAYKVSKGMPATLNMKEKAMLAKAEKVDSLKKSLKEAKRFVRSAQVKLTEGDQMIDAAADVNAAGAAVNQAGADAAAIQAGDANVPATPLPQNIIDEITNIKTQVDTLASEAGIESPVDLGADATAGVPGVTGAGDPNAMVADPAMGADPNAAPMMESKLTAVQRRIAEREARLAEGVVDNAVKAQTAWAKNTNLQHLPSNKIDASKSAEQIKVPGTQALLNGVATGPAKGEMAPAKRWPTKNIADPGKKKLGTIEESESTETTSRAEAMVESMMKPRFNWNEWLKSDANTSVIR